MAARQVIPMLTHTLPWDSGTETPIHVAYIIQVLIKKKICCPVVAFWNERDTDKYKNSVALCQSRASLCELGMNTVY